MSGRECICDVFDMGPRCAGCVEQCAANGHPFTEAVTNGQNHHCGVIL